MPLTGADPKGILSIMNESIESITPIITGGCFIFVLVGICIWPIIKHSAIKQIQKSQQIVNNAYPFPERIKHCDIVKKQLKILAFWSNAEIFDRPISVAIKEIEGIKNELIEEQQAGKKSMKSTPGRFSKGSGDYDLPGFN